MSKGLKIIAVINQKGGVAKSTTAQAIAECLSGDGAHVLLVDADAQGNLSYALGVDLNAGNGTLYDALTGARRPDNCVARLNDRLDIIPASPSLAVADIVLKDVGKEYRLKETIAAVCDGGKYDFCVIDTPPSLGILTINALTAADGVVIPAQADAFSLQGIQGVRETIATVRKYCNGALREYGILLTRFSSRTCISRNVAEYLEGLKGGLRVFATRIRECTAVKEAQTARKGLFDYAPNSNATKDYHDFVTELKGAMR